MLELFFKFEQRVVYCLSPLRHFEIFKHQRLILSAQNLQRSLHCETTLKRSMMGNNWESRLVLQQYEHQKTCRANNTCSSHLLNHSILHIWHVALYSSLLCLFFPKSVHTVAAVSCFLLKLHFSTVWCTFCIYFHKSSVQCIKSLHN